jgi:ATP-dependent Clp protease adaptor protein ClpS
VALGVNVSKQQAAVAEPVEEVEERHETKRQARRKRQPRYHVILWNDDDHSYGYVIRMMQELFFHPPEQGFVIAREVDKCGRAICMTTTMERAELKRDQIHAYGKDAASSKCKGSMKASIEPEPS